MPQAVPEFQLLLTQLSHSLGSHVARLMSRLSRLTHHEALTYVSDAYPDLAQPYAASAADATALWYNEQPTTTGTTFVAKPAPLAPDGQLAANARWAALQKSPADALKGSATRIVFNQSRETVLQNVKREPGALWARYASANACSFCRLLATRGAVYQGAGVRYDPESHQYITVVIGGRNGKLRGTRQHGEKYHDHCHCCAVMVRPGDKYEPPAYVDQWRDDYKDAIKVLKKDEKPIGFRNILSAMEKQRRVNEKTSVPVGAKT